MRPVRGGAAAERPIGKEIFMNIGTIVVLLALAAAEVLAVRHMRRKKSAGGCGGSCGSCACGCPHADK